MCVIIYSVSSTIQYCTLFLPHSYHLHEYIYIYIYIYKHKIIHILRHIYTGTDINTYI